MGCCLFTLLVKRITHNSIQFIITHANINVLVGTITKINGMRFLAELLALGGIGDGMLFLVLYLQQSFLYGTVDDGVPVLFVGTLGNTEGIQLVQLHSLQFLRCVTEKDCLKLFACQPLTRFLNNNNSFNYFVLYIHVLFLFLAQYVRMPRCSIAWMSCFSRQRSNVNGSLWSLRYVRFSLVT